MRILVAAATRHGATREIADSIATGLTRRGLEAETRDVEQAGGLDGYDAVVLGSAVYMGHWLEPARAFVEQNAAALSERPIWLFSSGPLGPPEALKPEGDPVDVAEFVELTRARAHTVLAGRLDKRLLGLREKAMVVAVRAPEGDFRDPQAIDAFAAEIARDLGAST